MTKTRPRGSKALWMHLITPAWVGGLWGEPILPFSSILCASAEAVLGLFDRAPPLPSLPLQWQGLLVTPKGGDPPHLTRGFGTFVPLPRQPRRKVQSTS